MEKQLTNKIKIYRAIHNLTQEQLAEGVGVTRQTIIAIEKNKYVPSLELAFRIARVFQDSLENIFQYSK